MVEKIKDLYQLQQIFFEGGQIAKLVNIIYIIGRNKNWILKIRTTFGNYVTTPPYVAIRFWRGIPRHVVTSFSQIRFNNVCRCATVDPSKKHQLCQSQRHLSMKL